MIHYLENPEVPRSDAYAACGARPGSGALITTRVPDVVTCPVCQLVLGAPAGAIRIAAVVEVPFYPFRFVCASCEQVTTRVTTDEGLAQRWTRLLRMGFPLLCVECYPDPAVDIRLTVVDQT